MVNPFVALNPRAIPPSFLFLSFLLPSFNLPPLPSPVPPRLNCFLELPFASSQRRRVTINYETNRTNARFLRVSILRWKGGASMIPYNADSATSSSFDPLCLHPLCFENFPSVRPFQESHLEKYSSIVIASGDSRDPERASRLPLFSRTVNNRSR